MSILNKITDKIDNLSFDEAIDLIKTELESGMHNDNMSSKLHYLLGISYSDYRNNNKNLIKARNAFLNSINYSKPFHLSYIEYTDLIDDEQVIINVLSEGLKKNPLSVEIITRLLSKDFTFIDSFRSKISNLKFSERNLYPIIEIMYNSKEFKMVNQISSENIEIVNDNEGRMQLTFIKVVSLYYLGDLEQAINYCEFLIEKDIHNSLGYLHYLMHAFLLIKTENIDKGFMVFNKIPVNNNLVDFFDGPSYKMTIFFDDIISEIFTELKKHKSNKLYNEINANAIYSLYLYYPSQGFDLIRYKESNRKSLDKYNKKYPGNKFALSALYQMSISMKKHFDAYMAFFEMIAQEIDTNNENCLFSYDIEEFSKSVLPLIVEHLVINYTRILNVDNKKSFEYLIDPLISSVYNSGLDDKYVLIEKINKIIKHDNNYKITSRLFEIAYSLNQLGHTKQSEKYYSYIYETNQTNHYVINNLGVIYSNAGDYVKAEEYYLKAFQLDKTSELYKNNYMSTKAKNHIRKHAIDNALIEPMNRLSLILNLYDLFYDDTFILTGYSDLDTMLYKLIDKSLFEDLIRLEYFELIKVSANQYHYQKNLYVKELLNSNRIIVEKNSHMSSLTLQDYHSQGFNVELIKQLSLIADKDYSRIIIKDVNECVNSILVKNEKSAIVLAGSITEAILINHLKETGVTTINTTRGSKTLSDCTLQELIEESQKTGVLKNRSYYSAHMVRDYRNFIHPDKMLRENADTDEKLVLTVWNLLKNVINEVLPLYLT
jgi:tetratricopeptide (TPR) repeat protein